MKMLLSAPAASKLCRLCFKPCIFLILIYMIFMLTAYSEFKTTDIEDSKEHELKVDTVTEEVPSSETETSNIDEKSKEIETYSDDHIKTVAQQVETDSTKEINLDLTTISPLVGSEFVATDMNGVEKNENSSETSQFPTEMAFNDPGNFNAVAEKDEHKEIKNLVMTQEEIPLISKLPTNESENMVQEFYNILQNPPSRCNKIVEIGGDYIMGPDNKLIRDGQKDVCMESPVVGFKPIQPGNCTVYSFGVGYDWSFEKDATRTLNCKVHAFDPEPKYLNHGKDHRPMRDLWFYGRGIGAKNGFVQGDGESQWRLQTLDTMMKELGHSRIDLLKMDIQGWEWKVLEQMISSGILKQVNHLCIELHFSLSKMNNQIRMTRLLESQGFQIFSAHPNPTVGWTYMRKLNRSDKLQYEVAWFRV